MSDICGNGGGGNGGGGGAGGSGSGSGGCNPGTGGPLPVPGPYAGPPTTSSGPGASGCDCDNPSYTNAEWLISYTASGVNTPGGAWSPTGNSFEATNMAAPNSTATATCEGIVTVVVKYNGAAPVPQCVQLQLVANVTSINNSGPLVAGNSDDGLGDPAVWAGNFAVGSAGTHLVALPVNPDSTASYAVRMSGQATCIATSIVTAHVTASVVAF